MSVYPENSSIPFDNPVPVTMEFKTLASRHGKHGEEQTKQQWLYCKREIGPLKYSWIDKASEARPLWQFYQARKGAFEAFIFYLPNSDQYVGEYVGTGDGATTVFNLPCKSSSGRTIYVDGVSQTEGVDYTFSAGGGVDGADKITFTAAPATGQYVTIDFTGLLKIRCRFKEDKLKYEEFYDRLTKIGIKFKGLLNA